MNNTQRPKLANFLKKGQYLIWPVEKCFFHPIDLTLLANLLVLCHTIIIGPGFRPTYTFANVYPPIMDPGKKCHGSSILDDLLRKAFNDVIVFSQTSESLKACLTSNLIVLSWKTDAALHITALYYTTLHCTIHDPTLYCISP